MADQSYSFDQVKMRLEDIVGQVKRKDITLEQSLELLEESVRLANTCNELVDQATIASSVSDDHEAADQGAGADHESAGGAEALDDVVDGASGDDGAADARDAASADEV